MEKLPQRSVGSSIWPRTDWSGLAQAARLVGKDPDRLGDLIGKYRFPLGIYLISTFPSQRHCVGEILQDFAQDRILQEGWLSKANRCRGRFRNFLKASLRNFVHDRLRRQAASPESINELEIDPVAAEAASEAFDLNWARTILDE